MWGGIFPGQGSQHSGMGQFLYDEFKIAKELFEEASDTLNLNFKKLCFTGSETELSLTENTQPCLLLVSTVSFKVLDELAPLSLKAAAGHSIGEYAAMVTAGAMSFSDALVAVRKRGEFMQTAVPVGKGGMLAVMGLSNDQVRELCTWAEKETGLKPVSPANFNAPGQVVISGNKQLIDWIPEHARKDIFKEPPSKIRFIPLKVSAPFHCSMMKPAEENMKPVLNDMPFSSPRFPIVQNVSAAPESKPEVLRNNLVAQISAPVRWVECVESLKSLSCSRLIEFGSGKVLSGLIRKIDSEVFSVFNMNSLDEIKALEKELAHA